MHAGHGNRALTGLAVVDGDDTATIDAPRYVMLVLAGGDAGVALDAAVGITKEFHPGHVSSSCSRCPDLAERGLGFLHPGNRIVAVGRDRVGAFEIGRASGRERVCEYV